MESFSIQGGTPLRGAVDIHGSKNAASKLMLASLLTKEPCVIENIPRSGEIAITRELCEAIGSRFLFEGEHRVRIETPSIIHSLVPELSRKNRIPVLALGPMLHRAGVAEVPVLGGCPIGHRPINFHVEALSKMGVAMERREKSYYAKTREIHGADIAFPYPSVGATENVLLTAVLARGRTRVKNAAVEPEILNLIEMLQNMGAKISCNTPERILEIEGVARLNGISVRVMPDRSEAVSLAVAVLATGGEVLLRGVQPLYLAAFLEKVRESGGNYDVSPEGIFFRGSDLYRPVSIETSPHPGFMTDWQQPFGVLLTQAHGESIIHETVYEDRFGYIKDLKRMGARIFVSTECPGEKPCRFYGKDHSHTARISGPRKLRGRDMVMTDIRAGMAHVIAALAAEGKSVISGIEHIDRGYEKIDERLRALGADIKRISN